MSPLVTFLTALWMSSASAQLGFITNLAQGAGKEVAAVADPVEKIVVAVGSSQCKTAKKILGVDYQSYEKDDGPDLTKLTLNFITRSVNLTYNLTDAAVEIPRSQWFNPRLPLKIYMHGFTDNPSKDSYQNISNAFLVQGDCNIVALDASSLIRWLYLRASTMVRFIGQALGQVLAALVHVGLHPDAIHLIGHSLGSHIAGFAGKTFTDLTGLRVGRISGLDPAGPCFSDVEEMLKLNVIDAVFVDVIHTDEGVFGIDQQVGVVDFYPNSGSQQPNCLLQTCSHSRAWLFFAESVINPMAFIGVKCDSWDDFKKRNCDFNDTRLMGYACPDVARGRYYLQTNKDYPFGKGVDGLTFVDDEAIARKIVDFVF